MTRTTFYLDNDGEVFAYFPDLTADHHGNKTCYAHYGQHSACNPKYLKRLHYATPEQYASLKQELTSIGYELKIKFEPKYK